MDAAHDASDERPILVTGDPRLRGVALPVERWEAEVAHAGAQMAATLTAFRRRHGFGRALAAPQLGIARRMIAVDLGAGPFLVTNPEIQWRSAEMFDVWDDCFSVPDALVRVRRHRSISLTYRDEAFRLRRWERLSPDLAELLQHEIDHLDGILMTDRAVGDAAVQPASARDRLVDAARPAHRLSLARIADAHRRIDPVFLATPQFVNEPLSEQLGAPLTLKVETFNPIRSFKGRGASLFVAMHAAHGAPLVCASAGNFGQGLAYACRHAGVSLVVYAARTANPLKVDRMRALGAEVRLSGDDFDAAKDAAQAWATATGATLVVDGLAAAIAEGAGTIGRELCAGEAAYDAVYLPVGNGALITGVARWIKARSPATRVIGVASAGAPVMAAAFRAGRVDGTARPFGLAAGRGQAPAVDPAQRFAAATIADGIAVRVAIPEAVTDMLGVVDDVVTVDDAAILDAMRALHEHAGIVVEPAGAAGLAALRSARDAISGISVATVLCGGNVTPEQMRTWLGPEPTLQESL